MDPAAHLDENRLVDFTEGLLCEADRATVERHLDECPGCRSLVAELVKSDSVISPPDSGAPPPGDPGAALVLHKGSTLGRYVILERLGAGGMGVVYAAFDPQLDRKISLKLLRTDVVLGASAAEARSRLLREAQAMARLSHPNVIAVHDVGTIGEQVFFAMEFVDGGTLATWLEEKPRPLAEVLEMFTKAGRGLSAAHAAGLVHRDFKPDNVLVGRDGRVRVTDFGLARPAASTMTPQVPLSKEDLELIRAGKFQIDAPLTQAGALLGTPAYMAPEQLQGRQSDARTDQFSFCVALYEALYGERPLKGSTVAALTISAELGLIRRAPQASRVPERLRRVLLRGLSATSEARFPTMDALLAELTTTPPLVRPALLAAGVALVSAVAVAGWYLARPAPPVLCKNAGRRLAGIWDETRRQEVRRALDSPKVPYAAAAATSVERLLDAYSASWALAQTAACEASRASAKAHLADRVACLGRRRDELAALSRQLAAGDANAIEHAVAAAGALEDPRACAAEDRARLKAPADAATREKVLALEVRLAEVKALSSLGQGARALELAKRIAAEAREIRHRPIEAEALLAQGAIVATMNDSKAEAILLEAVRAAEAGHHDEAAARAWTALAELSAGRSGGADQGANYAGHALAAIEGLGEAPALEGRALTVLGRIQAARGARPAAIATLRQALSIEQAAGRADHPAFADAQLALARALASPGEPPAEATATAAQALALHRKLYGDEHPRTRAARRATAPLAMPPPGSTLPRPSP